MDSVTHMFISGRVQGVGFRYFVLRLARQYDVRGFVRNISNGDVEVYAVGDPEKIGEFAAKVKVGPSHAFVARVSENSIPIQSSSFSIFDVLEDE